MDPRAPKSPAATPDTDTVAATVPADVHPPPPYEFPFLSPPQQPDEIGRLGPYRVLGVLGKGGMGAVFRADDPRLNRQLAVKVLLPDLSGDPHAVARFRREAQAQAAVEHDHVIPIFEVEEANGVVYLAMPLLKGQTLAQALKLNRNPPVAEVVRVGREIAEGLSAAHAKGLIHRDIKPANVWLEGDKRRVKILDFGLARVTRDTGNTRDAEPATLGAIGGATHDDVTQLTAAGSVMGTPAYMSPEQALGQQPLDVRSDVFSLGVVLYEMAAGRKPFAGASRFDLMAAVATHHPPAAHAANPEVPAALSELIWRMMAKSPGERPQSCAAVADELETVGRGLVPLPVVVPLPGGLPNPWRDLDATDAIIPTDTPPDAPRAPYAPPRRGWRVWAATAAALLLAAAAVGAVAWHLNRPPPPVAEIPDTRTDEQKQRDEQRRIENEKKRDEEKRKRDEEARLVARQRELAEWVLTGGGRVNLEGVSGSLTSANQLPRTPFRVQAVYVVAPDGRPGLTDADVKHFRDNDSITLLDLSANGLTDTGLGELLAQPFAAQLITLDAGVPKVSDAGLKHLARCPNLATLRLVGGAFTGAGLDGLSLPKLTRLQLVGGAFTGAGLAKLRAPALTLLTLTNCPAVEDGAAVAAAFPKLSDLTLSDTAATAAGYQALAKSKAFVKLTVSGRAVSAAEVAAIAGLGLSNLNLGDTKLTDAAVPSLAKMSKLGTLSLAGNPGVTDRSLEALVGLKFLRNLNVTGTAVTGGGVRTFRAAQPLCAVTTHTDQESDRKAAEWVLARGGTVSVVANGTGLTVEKLDKLPAEFILGSARFTMPKPEPGALAALRDAERLSSLYINGPGFDDAALKELAACGLAAKLNQLVLSNVAVTDAGLAELAKFPQLDTLQLHTCPITGAGLMVCRDMPALSNLSLNHCPVTDAGVKTLRGHKLTRLALDRTKITAAACADIATLPNLSSLSIEGTAITDAGLIQLAPLTKLTSLSAHKTKVTKEGVFRLFEELPFTNMVFDGGATPFNVHPLERAKPALEWAVKAGTVVQVEFSPGGNPVDVKAIDKPPADARLAYLGFTSSMAVPGVPRGGGGAAGRLEALAEGLKGLPAVAWSSRRPTLGFSHGVGTGAGLAKLAEVRGLRPVTHLNFLVEDAGRYTPHVGAFPNLRGLSFHTCKLTAEAVKPLADVRGLRELSVAQDVLAADTLKAVAALPLETLRLSQVTLPADAGDILAEMKGLTRLEFTKSPLPDAELAKIRGALPKCEILIDKQPWPSKK